jgi:hypothetical protein
MLIYIHRFYAPVLLALVITAGCASFTGPGLTTVMATTCANQSDFKSFRNCINSAWYNNIEAQGYAADVGVNQFMKRMRILDEAVSNRQMSDIQAIMNATDFAYQLKAVEQAQLSRQNDALVQALSRSAATAQVPNANSTVSCSRIGDISRQVFTFRGIACPVGFVPNY